MKKKALSKDFFREIKNTYTRFASILTIVALGVAFFSGVRASKPDMWLSGDALFDTYNLMDVRVISTLGLTDDDLEAIRKVEGVKEAEGVKTLEVLTNRESNQHAVRLITAPKDVNMIEVKEGRLPEKEDEILVDAALIKLGYKIGDTLEVISGTKEDISENLTRSTFTIVGAGNESYFISLDRGTASVGTGSLAGFAIAWPEVFKSEVYTEIDLTIEGAKDFMCYSDDYKDFIDEKVESIEAIKDERCEIRYKEVMDEGNSKIADGQKEIEDAKKKLSDAEKEIEDGQRTINNAANELKSAEEQIREGREQLAGTRKDLADKLASASITLEDLKGKKQQLDAGYAQVIDGINSLTAVIASLEASGQPEAAIAPYRAKLAEMKATKAELDEQRAALNRGIAAAESGIASINEGFVTISEKEKELEEGAKELEEGRAELNKNQNKLNEGKYEYETEKADADKKIADAEADIADAREKLADIKKPSWYVLDRDYLQTYTEYGQDAERIGNIGKIFPLVFFLVATLVSLTTMTRMVEEQRMQIGTLKALGYSKWDVAKKYIYYALLASVIGSVIGVFLGQWILPTVIIKAYKILYVTMGPTLTPMNAYYTFTSSAVAIACVVIATIFACYKELRQVPAGLMRPEVPKSGKRILLERVGFIWKRLNFTRKATLRNLFRYKKRFFMTIFGIGGCMALIVVGYGIKDSVQDIGVIQFGKIFKYQSTITRNLDESDEKKSELFRKLDEDSDVTAYMEIYETSIEGQSSSANKSGYLIVPSNKEELGDYITFKGRLNKEDYTLDDEGVLITEKLSILLNVNKGDTLTLKDSDNNYVNVKISAVTENYFLHYVYMSPALYEKVYGKAPEYNVVFVNSKLNTGAELKKFGEKYLGLDGVNNVTHCKTTSDTIEDMLKSFNIVIYVLIISAGILAFVVMYNLNNINIAERRRELATIKVLGFHNMETAMYIYRENVILTVLGIILGVFLGIILHRFVIVTAEIDLLMFTRQIMPISFLISTGFTILFTLIVNVVMFFQLKAINMVESLKSVE